MTTLSQIVKPALAEFGKELLAAGFKVYVYRGDVNRVAKGGLPSVATGLGFSRVVDGQVCYASVGLGYFDAANFSMPIKPSQKNGSSMWIGGSRELKDRETYGSASEALVVENADLYASPTGHNPLVGTQRNHANGWDGLYVEVNG